MSVELIEGDASGPRVVREYWQLLVFPKGGEKWLNGPLCCSEERARKSLDDLKMPLSARAMQRLELVVAEDWLPEGEGRYLPGEREQRGASEIDPEEEWRTM